MQPSRTAGVQEPLSFAPPNSDEATRAAHEAPFNQRARWRMRLHHTDDNGTAWFVCPFCAGALSATGMKVYNGATPGPRATPVTGHMRGHEQCCNGLVRLTAEELGRWQDIPAGTTAHWYAYHARRQQVENANSALKATQTQLNSKHTLVFGLVKRQVLLGFTLAADNHNVGAAFSTRWMSYLMRLTALPQRGHPATRGMRATQDVPTARTRRLVDVPRLPTSLPRPTPRHR